MLSEIHSVASGAGILLSVPSTGMLPTLIPAAGHSTTVHCLNKDKVQCAHAVPLNSIVHCSCSYISIKTNKCIYLNDEQKIIHSLTSDINSDTEYSPHWVGIITINTCRKSFGNLYCAQDCFNSCKYLSNLPGIFCGRSLLLQSTVAEASR